MANTLIMRYNRIGDALITLPLIYGLATKYKNDSFTVVSNQLLKPLFQLMPSNVIYIAKPEKQSNGIFRGIQYSLKKKLFVKKIKEHLVDIHKIAFFAYNTIEKKIEKSAQLKSIMIGITDEPQFQSAEHLLNGNPNKVHIIDFHKKALSDIGYNDIVPMFDPSLLKNRDIDYLYHRLNLFSSKKMIGIAPFSVEEGKMYPLDKMAKVIEYYSNKSDCQVLVLGGGKKEKDLIDKICEKYSSVVSLINRLSFEEEILLIAKCSVVLSMDSANLHLASLLNTPVVSIWGSTSPINGYYPQKEDNRNIIMKNLDCQPCSLWGRSPCIRDIKYECLDISPQIIINKIDELLKR